MRKLRPLFGSPPTAWLGSLVEDSTLLTSTTGVAVTVTAASSTGSSFKARSTVSPTRSTIPVCLRSPRPTARARSSYVPSGSSGATNTPFSLVVTVRWNRVCVSVTVTCAPTTTFPDGSDTVPRITPVVAWACAAR